MTAAFGSYYFHFRLPRAVDVKNFQSADAIASLRAAVSAFNTLAVLGFVLLVGILLTACLSPCVRRRRVSTWYTYIIAWAIFCITPFPVLGHQTHADPAPSFAACVADTAIVYASTPLAAFATFALILHLYINVSAGLKRSQVHPTVRFFLMATPLAVYCIVFLLVLALGLRNPEIVELKDGGFYCHLKISWPAMLCASLDVFGTVAAVVAEAMTVILLRRNWRAFRELQRKNENGVCLSLIIRISIFAVLPVIGLGFSFFTYVPDLVEEIFAAYNIFLAMLPVFAALIFGSQTVHTSLY
ncbi:hypothetical protein FB451DRAFT_1259250 [Mycena latifolia]|nr:hypothetical protein FB451DRAFT_1259250 [Mycena latifolia]